MYGYDVEAFMGACARKGLSEKTQSSYEQTLRLFGLFLAERGITQTEDIRHPHIEAYIDYIRSRGKYTVCSVESPASPNYPERRIDYAKKVSPVTINNYLRNLKAFFSWCVREELIGKNPVKPEDTIKVERRPLAFVSDAEFKRLLASLDVTKFSEYRDSVIIRTLLDTGMRCGECLAVKVTDLDLQKQCINLPADITKGRKGRYVFFSVRTGKVLKRWLQYKDRYRDSEYLFCTNGGKALQVNNFEANIRKWAGNLLNLFLYVPFGWTSQRWKPNRKKIVVVAFMFSVCCETLQYFTGRGMADVNDILFNTLGAVAGAWFAEKVD